MAITPNMTLDLPVVSSTLGPEWATLLNAAFSLVDSHDHSDGKGVKITPAGINISSNLSFNNFYLTSVGSLRLTSLDANLSAPADVGCFYNKDGDLWWNNDGGGQVQITSGGSVIAASDGIARSFSRVAVASNTIINAAATVSYYDVDTTSSVTFTLPAANAVSAGRFYEFKDTVGQAATNNIVISRAGSDTIDGATSFTIANNYGAIRLISDGASKWAVSRPVVDTSQIRNLAVTTEKINDGAVTQAKRAALGQQVSLSSGAFSTSSTTDVDVTNLSVTITTTGRPVFIGIVGDGGAGTSQFSSSSTNSTGSGLITFLRGATTLNVFLTFTSAPGATSVSMRVPPSSFFTIDLVAAGTYTYKVQARVNDPSRTVQLENTRLIAYEL